MELNSLIARRESRHPVLRYARAGQRGQRRRRRRDRTWAGSIPHHPHCLYPVRAPAPPPIPTPTRLVGIGWPRAYGTHFSFANVVRKFAFVIADITPSLVSVLEKYDFHNDWNPKVFVRYRERAAIFIQVFGFDTLVENAKKRNQAFFKVLLDE